MTTTDRRSHPRYRCRLDTRCHSFLSASDGEWEASLRDLSRGGLRCVLKRRFEIGTVLKLEIPAQAEENRLLLVQVVRVERYPRGRWEIGCRLHRDLDERDFQEMTRAHGRSPAELLRWFPGRW